MIAAGLESIAISFGSDPIFENLSWEIHDDRVSGLVGPNGCGKSTLLGLIAGRMTPDEGKIAYRQGLRIGYLAQDPEFQTNGSLLEEVMSANAALLEVESGLRRVEASLTDPRVYDKPGELARALARQERLLEEYSRLGGASYDGRVLSTLRGLGFKEEEFNLPLEALSGGQKKLAGLARLLVTEPNLLLLDEPDNHLDYDGKSFLVRMIRDFKGGVIIVSHDRYLLDLVADEIVELEYGKLSRFKGNYSEYAFEKRSILLRQQQLYQAQHKEITRLEQSAKRLMMWGKVYDNETFSKRGQAMLKRIERIERIDRPVLDPKRMGLELKGWRGSNKVLEVDSLRKTFPAADDPQAPEQAVLDGVDLLVWHGERVGLVGPNGSGKSLVFRLVLGEETPTGGRIVIGPSVRIGFYAQEHETLNPALTLIETIRKAAPLAEDGAVRFLGRFLFSFEQARGRVGDLSGGERSRLQLALVMLSGANFLLLDEPTNNLDIPSAEVLEEALEEFEGAVLVISHDRYFLDRVVGKIVELEGGKSSEFTGSYSDYAETRKG